MDYTTYKNQKAKTTISIGSSFFYSRAKIIRSEIIMIFEVEGMERDKVHHKDKCTNRKAHFDVSKEAFETFSA